MLGLVVTDHIFRTYPDLPEGELAKVAGVGRERRRRWPSVAAELELGDALLLGKGEDRSGGREKPSILADAMEAVIGAVYLDGGWERRADLVLGLLGDRIAEAAAGPGGPGLQDPAPGAGRPAASTCCRGTTSLDDGPDHAKRFFATVAIGRPARGGRGPVEEAGRAGAPRRVAAPVEVDAARRARTDAASRRPMPELPEVETIRRDLEREVVGKRIKTVEVTGPLDPPPHDEEAVHRPARGRQGHGRPAQGQVPAAASSTPATCSSSTSG